MFHQNIYLAHSIIIKSDAKLKISFMNQIIILIKIIYKQNGNINKQETDCRKTVLLLPLNLIIPSLTGWSSLCSKHARSFVQVIQQWPNTAKPVTSRMIALAALSLACSWAKIQSKRSRLMALRIKSFLSKGLDGQKYLYDSNLITPKIKV